MALLWLAAERLGGVREAADIGLSPLRREPISATFHGRDIFAPVAAHLATGTPLAQVGEPLDPAALVRLELPRAHVSADGLIAHVLHADRYGNVMLDADADDLPAAGLRRGEPVMVGPRPAHYGTTFADVPPGELLLYEDSYRVLSLAVNRGSALRALGLRLDDEILLAPLGAVTARLGRPRLHHRVTDSTSTVARALAAAGAPHGTLVTAGEQRAGRGRQGRTWSAPAGGALLMSLVLREWPPLVPMVGALAVADVAAAAGDETIKWPNDVLLGGRKLAGVLGETRPQEGWAVLGIGMNVAVRVRTFPPSCTTAPPRSASRRRRSSRRSRRSCARSSAASRSRPSRRSTSFARATRCATGACAGRRARGFACGIDDEGRLLVQGARAVRSRSPRARCTCWRPHRGTCPPRPV